MATIYDLGKKVKAKYPGVYDDMPDEELGRRVKGKYPGSYDDFADESPGQIRAREAQAAHAATSPFLNPEGQKVYAALGSPDIGRMAAGALPTVGSIAGGIGGAAAGIPLGPPGIIGGGIAGAGLGGAAGEAGREALMGEPLNPGRIGMSGLVEGAFQPIGGLAAKGAVKASPWLARRAVALARRRGGGLMDMVGGTVLGHTLGGFGVQGAAAGAAKAAAQSPMANRALSKLLGSIKFQRLARQSPRAAAALVQQTLSAEPDATAQP